MCIVSLFTKLLLENIWGFRVGYLSRDMEFVQISIIFF